MKILPVGAELYHSDEQIDMTNPMVTFHSSLNGPKNGQNNLKYA